MSLLLFISLKVFRRTHVFNLFSTKKACENFQYTNKGYLKAMAFSKSLIKVKMLFLLISNGKRQVLITKNTIPYSTYTINRSNRTTCYSLLTIL